MIFRLCNGKHIEIPQHLVQFGQQFQKWGDYTSCLAEFLQKNTANNFAFLLGAASMRKKCTFELCNKVRGQYQSYLEPLGGLGIDAKLLEGDPALTTVNDIDPGCLEVLRANFPAQAVTSYNFFKPEERAALLQRPADLIFIDYNNYTLAKLEQGTYLKETREVFGAAQKFVVLNDCSVFFLKQYGRKSYELYSRILGRQINYPRLEEYFHALADGPLYRELGWYLTDVVHFYWASSRGNDVSSYQLFRRTPKPLEIQFVSREELQRNPMLVVELLPHAQSAPACPDESPRDGCGIAVRATS